MVPVSGAFSNRKHGLFHLRYFENGLSSSGEKFEFPWLSFMAMIINISISICLPGEHHFDSFIFIYVFFSVVFIDMPRSLRRISTTSTLLYVVLNCVKFGNMLERLCSHKLA